MSEAEAPTRLLDDPETSVDLRNALLAGRDEAPDERQLASLAARLGPLMGPGGGGGGAPPDPGLVAGAGASAKVIAAIGVAAVAATVAIGIGISQDEPPTPTPTAETTAVASESPPEPATVIEETPHPEPTPEPAETVVEPTAPRVRRPRPREPAAPPAPAFETDPSAELELIRAAQAALGASPAHALELASEHRRRFGPSGTLAQEREVVAIDALSRLDRGDAARQRADRFHTRWPRSAHGRRIDVIVTP